MAVSKTKPPPSMPSEHSRERRVFTSWVFFLMSPEKRAFRVSLYPSSLEAISTAAWLSVSVSQCSTATTSRSGRASTSTLSCFRQMSSSSSARAGSVTTSLVQVPVTCSSAWTASP